ncbi:class I SAM-dependent methyltransferase [bacterium]|nr:class I SAM-dependent methyltransferase [bacterium]
MIDLQPLVNKTVEFAYRGARLNFDLSHALFSSFAIDTGTRFLLKEIAHDEALARAESILDAGCGTGIIGVSLAASCPSAKVVLRDRDLLACAFAERNCWRNGIAARRFGIDGAEAEPIAKRAPKHKNNEPRTVDVLIAPGLLGEADPLGPYDFVASNVPAKAGPAILERFVRACAGSLLNPGGRLAFVIVNTLAPLADGWCAAAPGLALVKRAAGKGHTVFVLEKAAPPAGAGAAAPAAEGRPAAGGEAAALVEVSPLVDAAPVVDAKARLAPYRRSGGERRLGRYKAKVSGFQGLPEFDTASFATELSIEALEKACAGCLVRDFLVAEPGIGLSALWARAALGPARIHALSRDFLALLAAAANLEAQGAPVPEYLPLSAVDLSAEPEARYDAILWNPDEIPEYDDVSPAWGFLSKAAKAGAAGVAAGTATAIARFDKAKPSGMQRLGEKKRKGFAAAMYRRVEVAG